MDDPGVPDAELLSALTNLERLNRGLRGYAPSRIGLEMLTPPGARKISVLDVGAGSGDGARRIVDWALARGMEPTVHGIELSETTVAYARLRCAGYPSISVDLQDLFTLPAEPRYDVAHAAQVLHHFPGDEAARAVGHMLALSRWGVVINDLHRNAVAWLAAKSLTKAFTRDRLVQHDGPLSVLRAFDRGELESIGRATGASSVEVRWCALYRWCLVLRP